MRAPRRTTARFASRTVVGTTRRACPGTSPVLAVRRALKAPRVLRVPRALKASKGHRVIEGPPGPRGPSDSYTDYSKDVTVSAASGGPFNLGSLSLPAGSFMVFGRASVLNNAFVPEAVTCELGPPGAKSGYPIFATDEAHLQGLPLRAQQTMTLLGPVDLTSGAGEVDLICFLPLAGGPGSLTFTDIQVSAIQVGTIQFPPATTTTTTTTTTATSPCPGATDTDGDGDQNGGGVDDGDGCL